MSLSEAGAHLWTIDRPTQDIVKEFEALAAWRTKLWFKDPTGTTREAQDPFMIAQPLLIHHRYRDPSMIAFEYNHTDDSYNASSITLNGLRFLALEAPSERTLDAFFHLLYNFQVTHLVRLTPATVDGVEKSYPYWKENEATEEGKTTSLLHIPLETGGKKRTHYTIPYTTIETWKGNHAISPQKLLSLILRVRQGHTPSSLVAVHCHSSVGRTGTFIAGFALLREIDKQVAAGKKLENLDISIEEVVKKLNLQRPMMVQVAQQYLMLYRLVDLYVKNLKSKKEGKKGNPVAKPLTEA